MTNNQAQQTLNYLNTIVGDLNQIQSYIVDVDNDLLSESNQTQNIMTTGFSDVDTTLLNGFNMVDSWASNFSAKYWPLLFVVMVLMAVKIMRR